MGGLLGLAVLLVVLWLVALLVFKVAGLAIHLVILVAIVLFVLGLIRRRT
jgi:hypothetical protein